MSQIRCLPAGDMALNVDFGSEISEPVNNQVQSLMQALDDVCIPGIIEAVPTFRSVLIHYDPLQIGYDTLCEKVTALTKGGVRGGASLKRIFEIPVCYGARFGVDLHDGEKLTGLTADEIIAIHSGAGLPDLYAGISAWISLSGRHGSPHCHAAPFQSTDEDSRRKCWNWRLPDRHLPHAVSWRMAASWRYAHQALRSGP